MCTVYTSSESEVQYETRNANGNWFSVSFNFIHRKIPKNQSVRETFPSAHYDLHYCLLSITRITILSHSDSGQFSTNNGERPTQVYIYEQSRYFMHKKQCARKRGKHENNKQITIGRSRLICFIRIPLRLNLFILGIADSTLSVNAEYCIFDKCWYWIRTNIEQIMNFLYIWVFQYSHLALIFSACSSTCTVYKSTHKQGSRDSQASIELKPGIE